MDSQSRQTASTYINNLLLSRGLLRNGSPIEFARPGQVEGGLDATMSQIMSLVHDLILRRDVRLYSNFPHEFTAFPLISYFCTNFKEPHLADLNLPICLD